MKCEVRTLALTKRLAKALPIRAWKEAYIPNVVGFVFPEAIGKTFCQKFVLVQLQDLAFWCSVSWYTDRDLNLSEITLY